MRCWLNRLVLSATVTVLAPMCSAQDCRVIDLMPDFWRFWDAARDRPAAEQNRLFDAMLAGPHAAVYEGVFSRATRTERMVPTSLEQAKPYEAALRRSSAELGTQLPQALALFRKTFPDFQCSKPVYFVFSAGAFDGAVRQVGGESALLFGLDMIARLQNAPGPLVIHELFHVHHARVAPGWPDTVGRALWSEGLATYVSRALHPDLAEQQIAGLPPAAPIEALMPSIATELRQHFDSGDEQVYARYFLGGKAQDVPARSGYYVGYRVATELGRTRSLDALARLDAASAGPLIKAALLELARAQPAPSPAAPAPRP